MTQTVGRHRREDDAAPTQILHTLLLENSHSTQHSQLVLKEILQAMARRGSYPENTTVHEPYFRRHCYDKPHRCPGWAGGGRKYPVEGQSWCEGGSLELTWNKKRAYRNDPWLIWRWHRCNTCGVRAIPIAVKYFDLVWWYTCQLKPFLSYLGQDLEDLRQDGDWAWFWSMRKPQPKLWAASVKQWFERLGRWWRKDYERD